MDNKPVVKASATVDKIMDGPIPLWEVQVSGESPHNHRRTYTLRKKTDNDAAQEGIKQFVVEMENLNDNAVKD